jgi:hypothetical protein
MVENVVGANRIVQIGFFRFEIASQRVDLKVISMQTECLDCQIDNKLSSYLLFGRDVAKYGHFILAHFAY